MIDFPGMPLAEEPLMRNATIDGVLRWWDELSFEQRLWVFAIAHALAPLARRTE